jgi:hypothetical protein
MALLEPFYRQHQRIIKHKYRCRAHALQVTGQQQIVAQL